MGDFGFSEILVIGIIAILIYGKDLPQVARKLAYYYNKLRRHMNDIRDEIQRQIPAEDVSLDSSSPSSYPSEGEPPPAPTGLTATLEDSHVVLNWDSTPGADHYSIKRTTIPEGSMDTIATGLSFTSYTDTSPPVGETCSYVVSASNTYGEGGDSMEVTVTLPASTDAAPPAAGGAGEAGTAPAPAPSPTGEAAPPTDEGNGSPEPEPARPAAPSEESEPETMH